MTKYKKQNFSSTFKNSIIYLNDISNKIREYMKVFNTGFLEAYNEVIH